MSLKVKEGAKGDYEITPAGNYVARCFKLIDMGTQTVEFAGETKFQQKILISWELLDPITNMKDGRPFAVSKRYTASLHEKSALRKDLQSWRGKRFTDEELEGFDLTKILGAWCQLQVIHTESNGTTYANVDAIMSTREKPTGINELMHFDIDEPDLEVFNSLSEKMQETIKATPEWRARLNPEPEPQAPVKELDTVIDFNDDEPINLDDIPF
jgi:hypothetical protein